MHGCRGVERKGVEGWRFGACCGGVLAGSDGEGGAGEVVAIGVSGKAGGVGQRQVAMCGGRSE